MTAPTGDARTVRAAAQEIDALLADPQHARVDAPAPFLETLAQALASSAATVAVDLGLPGRLEAHSMTLSRAGVIVLRSARSDATDARLSLLPLTALPGAVARLAGIAPTLPCSPGTVVVPPKGTQLDQLFSPDPTIRGGALSALEDAAGSLIGTPPADLDRASARAVRISRTRNGVARSAVAAQVHGRFLLADAGGRFLGTDPTSLARELVRTAIARD